MSSSSHAALVLIVDDDAELRRMLETAVSSRGYRVVTAGNGRQAIAQLRKEVPRLIVLDYWMPVLDGAGFMLEMKKLLPQRPPVILLTAALDKPYMARALGVDVYVEKPVAMSRLVKLIEVTIRAAPAVDVQLPKDRRERVRVACRQSAWLKLPGEDGLRGASTVDVSETGIALELDETTELADGTDVGITLESDGAHVVLPAQVRNVSERRVGLSFAGLDARASAALQKLLRG